jgi:predicted metal-dependent enzyme (double-stranded beta helix superfamily)
MFDLERFIADCQDAIRKDGSHKAVQEVVARAVSDPAAVLKELGEPRSGGVHKLHQSPTLTVLNVVWRPMMTVMPHDHRMWAVIGVYSGREDNIFWRRLDAGDKGIEAAGARALSARDCTPLGESIIHSVTNPIPRHTGALHVYGGDFFAAERSEWDAESLREQRFDVERAQRRFAEG